MQKQKKSKKRQVEYNGRLYTAITKNGDAFVRTQCGSQGQNIIIGILDIATGIWRNESAKFPVPTPVKQQMELILL